MIEGARVLPADRAQVSMKRSLSLSPLASVLLAGPLLAQVGEVIDGATIEFSWPLPGTVFRELEALHFRSGLEEDCVALCDDQVVLVYHPGRFNLVYSLADGVNAIAVVPLGDGTEGVLTVSSEGLELIQWAESATGFTSSTTLSTGPWSDATELWAFDLDNGVLVCGFDPVQSRLLWGDFDGDDLTDRTSLPLAEPLRDLLAIEWTDEHDGPELAWLFENNLFVSPGDASLGLEWCPVAPTDQFGVARGGSEDVLVWVSSWLGQPTLYARGGTTVYVPYQLDSAARSDLVVIDRDGDGHDDVVITSAVDATATVLRRGATTFMPFTDGGTLELTTTSGEATQTSPVIVGTSGDFDNDGTQDLFFGQVGALASQYIGRPDWEERYRPALQSDGGPIASSSEGIQTLAFVFQNPFYRQWPTFHVQAFVRDWTTGLLDPTPLDDFLQPYDTGSPTTSIAVSYPIERLPVDHAVFVLVGQVDTGGATILSRRPVRGVYYSPSENIEAELALDPYPWNSDPLDPGNGTGGRLANRVTNPTLIPIGAEPPPP